MLEQIEQHQLVMGLDDIAKQQVPLLDILVGVRRRRSHKARVRKQRIMLHKWIPYCCTKFGNTLSRRRRANPVINAILQSQETLSGVQLDLDQEAI